MQWRKGKPFTIEIIVYNWNKKLRKQLLRSENKDNKLKIRITNWNINRIFEEFGH